MVGMWRCAASVAAALQGFCPHISQDSRPHISALVGGRGIRIHKGQLQQRDAGFGPLQWPDILNGLMSLLRVLIMLWPPSGAILSDPDIPLTGPKHTPFKGFSPAIK